ncbi:unnamed protein product [Scytosiphon promiscuus]
MRKGEPRKKGNTGGACATDASTAYKQGLKLCGDGMYGKALPLFDRAIAFRADCPHYFFARANCLQAIGQHVNAYHDYVSAISLNRTKCTYFSCRGLCLMKMGKLDSALSDFSRACELEPTAAVYHYQKASLLHHRLGRPGEAVVSYSECLANTGPTDSAMTLRCLHAKGACLFEEGRPAEAVTDLSRAVELSDPSPASLHYLAKALKAVGREKRAMVVLGDALEKWEVGGGASKDSSDNSRHEAFFDRGVIRLNRGDDAGALSDFDKAVALSHGARGEYFVQRARARARVAMRSNGREEAMAGVQDIEKAMELESNNPEFLFTAGVLCSRMGEHNRALGHLQLLLDFFQTHGDDSRDNTRKETKEPVASLADCEFETALCLYKLGRPSEALRLAESALTAGRSLDARRFQLRGLILHDLGRYGDAVKDFTASLAVDGQRPEGLLLRGRSMAGLGSHERAIGDFTTALAVLRSKQSDRRSEDRLGASEGGCCQEDSSSVECEEQGEEGGRDADSTAAKSEKGNGGVGDTTTDAVLDDRRAQVKKRTSRVSDQQQPLGKDGLSRKLSRENTGRRGSQRADGGDGMDDGVSVVGACHYASRALSLQQRGNHADAAADFDAAVAEGPISWQRLWHRATCLAELGKPYRASAKRDLRDCLSLAEEQEPPPEARNFLFQVGLAYLRLGESATALMHFDRAKKVQRQPVSYSPKLAATSYKSGSPQDARTLFRRGWANKALGDLAAAAADFEAARLLEPLHPHLSVDYRNIFGTELVVVDDDEHFTQAPAFFHSW